MPRSAFLPPSFPTLEGRHVVLVALKTQVESVPRPGYHRPQQQSAIRLLIR